MNSYTNRNEYLSKLLAYKDKDLIKVVSGLRRSGKSTLFELYRQALLEMGIPENQIVFLNFEDFELRKYLSDLDALYAYIISQLDVSKPCYVFLDEVQNVNEFERLVDGLFVKKNIDVYITGSNAFFLSSELATLLSGRYIEISILPFSFKEYLTAREIDTSIVYLNYEALFFDYVNETSLPKGIALRELGFDICSNDEFVDYLRSAKAAIVEASTAAIIPALMGLPLLLAQYGKLSDQEYGIILTEYPRAKFLQDINNVSVLIKEELQNVDQDKVNSWIEENVGPMPASMMPERVAEVIEKIINESQAN